MDGFPQVSALIIFIIAYIGIIFTRLPGVNVDRPSAAFTGAVLMVLAGSLDYGEAIQAIDFNTIGLLLGMMVVITVLEMDGFFTLISQKTIILAKSPSQLLVIVTFVSGIASAFLVNDAVVLLFTPVIISICRSARLNPVPFLIAEIFAANIGSTMSITGNPQNMLIGIQSGISYGRFMLMLAPIAFLGLGLILPVIRRFFPETFRLKNLEFSPPETQTGDFSSMKTSVPIFLLVTLAFFFSTHLGVDIPVIALGGGALVLLFGRIRPSKVIRGVDWVLLLFFASLFILTAGLEKAGYLAKGMEMIRFEAGHHSILQIHFISLVLSQIVSNVPFVVAFLPFLEPASSETLWLSLASASTLAGNATMIGAMANLIVMEVASVQGVRIGFVEFLKPGLVITLLTLTLSCIFFLLIA